MSAAEGSEHPAPSGSTRGSRGRVLVMLGNPERSRVLARELSADGWEALDAAVGEPGPELLVTDSSGAGVRRSLPGVPALFLVPPEAAAGFVGGAAAAEDDYLCGPFTAEDLAVRLRWLRRRIPAGRGRAGVHAGDAQDRGPGPGADLTVGDLALVPGSLLARRAERGITLSKKQAALLALLMARAGSVVGKEEILRQVWGENLAPGNWNKVELCASALRRRIDAVGPPMIRTVRGAGYMIEAATATG